MAKYRIAWMPGDGVGKEVMQAARICLDALNFDAEYLDAEIGWDLWMKEGNPLPDRTLETLRGTDACLFGAITSKPKAEAEASLPENLRGKGHEYFSPIVRLRQEFDLHTNLRPCKAYPGNPLNYRDTIDLVVFRENTEGLYVGIEWSPVPEELWKSVRANHKKAARFDSTPLDEMAMSVRIITDKGARRIVTGAFEYAKKHGRKSVTLVEKPNVLRETSGLMTRVAREVAAGYPGIELWETNIDAMMMWLVKNPETYDVIVTSNMFGDITSDLCAQLVGGLGFACSGNIGDEYAVFEPTHGSAPKYEGQNKVNPIAEILTAKMMLEWLGEAKLASRLEDAVAEVIAEAKVRTYDMGGTSTTMELAEAVAAKL
ncbi:MAG TPA: isocitrate/isopropylmalate dehydrogenase family protein [Candidatus Krumholzibacteria bacterium]|nr:isocitrate/isopropylmalate dehydrogenase family protein [Candidatus Krumholzibacteria bacterium]